MNQNIYIKFSKTSGNQFRVEVNKKPIAKSLEAIGNLLLRLENDEFSSDEEEREEISTRSVKYELSEAVNNIWIFQITDCGAGGSGRLPQTQFLIFTNLEELWDQAEQTMINEHYDHHACEENEEDGEGRRRRIYRE